MSKDRANSVSGEAAGGWEDGHQGELLKEALAKLPRLLPRQAEGGEVEVPAYALSGKQRAATELDAEICSEAKIETVGRLRTVAEQIRETDTRSQASLPRDAREGADPVVGSPGSRDLARASETRPTAGTAPLPWLPREDSVRGLPEDVEVRRFGLPRLPQSARRRSYATPISFCVCVLLPTLLVAGYYYGVASNQYVAEFRFAVLESTPVLPGQPAPTQPASGSSSLASGLSALVGGGAGSSLTGASTQNFLVVDYLKSREAIRQLQSTVDLKNMYARRSVDWLSRFAANAKDEDFFVYWQSMIDASYDQVTGLARVEVRAFLPQDALTVAKGLVTVSEKLINTIVNRSNVDAVRFAEGEVKHAQDRLKDERAKLAVFRAREGVIDPTTSIVPANVAQLNALETSLITLKTQLNTLFGQGMSANSPSVRSIQAQITALNGEITRVKNEVSVKRPGNEVLADVVARYEKLNLDVQFDQSMVISTQQALDQARANAAAQHLYMTPYVEPQLVEKSTYPKRFQSTLLAGLLCFAVWLGGFLVIRAIQEHSI